MMLSRKKVLKQVQGLRKEVGLTAFLVLVSLSATAQDWSFDVSPYLWVANVGVETSLSGSSTPSSVERFDTSISAGAMLAAQIHYRSIGLFADFAWLRLDTEAIN